MSDQVSYARVDDYISNTLNTTLPSRDNAQRFANEQISLPPPELTSISSTSSSSVSVSSLSLTANPSQSSITKPIQSGFASPSTNTITTPFSATNTNAGGELASLRLQLKDALITADHYKLKLSQAEEKLKTSEKQQQLYKSSTRGAKGDFYNGALLDPEALYLQQENVSLRDHLSVLGDQLTLHRQEQGRHDLQYTMSREELVTVQRENVLLTHHVDRLKQLCSQFQTELQTVSVDKDTVVERNITLEDELELLKAKSQQYESEIKLWEKRQVSAHETEHVIHNLRSQIIDLTQKSSIKHNTIQSQLLVASQALNELKVEYEHLSSKSASELSAFRQDSELNYNRLATEYDLYKLKTEGEYEQVQFRFHSLLHAFQSQFAQYRACAEELLDSESKEYEKQLSTLESHHQDEMAFLLKSTDHYCKSMLNAKDAKIMALLDGTDMQKILLKHQVELDKMHQDYQARLKHARRSVENDFKKAVYNMRKLASQQNIEIGELRAELELREKRISQDKVRLSSMAHQHTDLQQSQDRKVKELEKNLYEKEARLVKVGQEKELLRHKVITLKLTVEGRNSGTLTSSLSSLQRTIDTLQEEVVHISSELQLKNSQTQHAVRIADKATMSAAALEKELSLVKSMYVKAVNTIQRLTTRNTNSLAQQQQLLMLNAGETVQVASVEPLAINESELSAMMNEQSQFSVKLLSDDDIRKLSNHEGGDDDDYNNNSSRGVIGIDGDVMNNDDNQQQQTHEQQHEHEQQQQEQSQYEATSIPTTTDDLGFTLPAQPNLESGLLSASSLPRSYSKPELLQQQLQQAQIKQFSTRHDANEPEYKVTTRFPNRPTKNPLPAPSPRTARVKPSPNTLGNTESTPNQLKVKPSSQFHLPPSLGMVTDDLQAELDKGFKALQAFKQRSRDVGMINNTGDSGLGIKNSIDHELYSKRYNDPSQTSQSSSQDNKTVRKLMSRYGLADKELTDVYYNNTKKRNARINTNSTPAPTETQEEETQTQVQKEQIQSEATKSGWFDNVDLDAE